MTPIGKFYDELNEYLDDKIPSVPVSARKEVSVHIAGMAIIREQDIVKETVEIMRKSTNRPQRLSKQELMERAKLLAEARREKIERDFK